MATVGIAKSALGPSAGRRSVEPLARDVEPLAPDVAP